MRHQLSLITGVHQFNGVTSECVNMAADNLNNSHAYCDVKVLRFLVAKTVIFQVSSSMAQHPDGV
jgi:hypothetical protein